MDVHNPPKNQLYINGQWVSAAGGKKFPVKNPANDALIAEVSDAGAADAKRAIAAAKDALPDWAKRTAEARSALLRAWYEAVLDNTNSLANLLTLEQGKPIGEAKGEVRYGADFIAWYAEEAKRAYGDVIASSDPNQRITVIKQAIGVVAAITPWNFPVAMITRKVAPALAAGCTVVIKPAEDTPLCALALASMAHAAGIPPGVINVVTTSDPSVVGEVLTTHKAVKKVSFTGSTEVGKLLMRQSAGTVKKLSLELGGNAPFIVFADADIAGAVAGAMKSKYRNAGQTCICANRFYVHESVAKAFVAQLAVAVRELTVGPGDDSATDIGPLIHRGAADSVKQLISKAVELGAKRHGNAATNPPGPAYVNPVILTDLTPEMGLDDVEIFGPVAPVYTFKTEEEVINLANATNFGLAAYFYGRDQALIWRVAEALEYGMVGINTGSISTAVAPFGGIKQSGFGREGGKYGLEEYLVTKYMCWDIS